MSLFAGSTRSKFESAAYTVLFLAFFFAVGLAGGVLYRVLPTHRILESPDSSAPVAATETPAASEAALPPVAAPAKISASAPSASEAAVPPPPKSSPAPAPAPVAVIAAPPPAAPSPTAPAAGPPAESVASVAKPAAPAERVAKTPTPPKPAASEPVATAKAAPAHAKAAEPAEKPKPVAVATAQPPKPAAVKHAPPAAHSTEGTPESGPFRIQFGAFAIEDNAHRIQWSVEATGIPVEITRAPNRKGHMLYYVRSQPFPDRDAALKAAVAARDKAKSFAQPVAIDYIVVSDTMIAAMQGETPKP